jgi:hypothetical protein
MTSTAKTIFYFGIYIIGLGLVLLLMPNVLLRPFGFEEAKEVWIRVLGVVVTALGYYYIVAAKSDACAFFNATIHGRTWLFLAFVVLAVLEQTKTIIMLFGAIDLAGAIWTWTAQRSGTQA